MQVYWHCPFSRETENETKAGILVLSILINRSYFQWNALNPGIYSFSGSSSLLALSVFMCDPNRGYNSHLDFILIIGITFWKQLCQICGHFGSLHQPRGV